LSPSRPGFFPIQESTVVSWIIELRLLTEFKALQKRACLW
jgi:hypothetical protein